MKDKPPILNGHRPYIIYDLENDEHLTELNLELREGLQTCDIYCKYPNGIGAVIEFKSKSLHDAAYQLESTAKELDRIGHQVDVCYIIAEKINRAERHLYYRDPRTHNICAPNTKQPRTLRLRKRSINIKLEYKHEVEREWQKPRQTKLRR